VSPCRKVGVTCPPYPLNSVPAGGGVVEASGPEYGQTRMNKNQRIFFTAHGAFLPGRKCSQVHASFAPTTWRKLDIFVVHAFCFRIVWHATSASIAFCDVGLLLPCFRVPHISLCMSVWLYLSRELLSNARWKTIVYILRISVTAVVDFFEGIHSVKRLMQNKRQKFAEGKSCDFCASLYERSAREGKVLLQPTSVSLYWKYGSLPTSKNTCVVSSLTCC